MKLSKEERILRVINRQDVDYLPSQIVFADRSRDEEISKALGLSKPEELDDYLENYLYMTFSLQDKPLIFRDIKDEINKLHKTDYGNPDWKNNCINNNNNKNIYKLL